MFTPGPYTFDPFDGPVFVESVETTTEDGIAVDRVTTTDAGTFIIAADTFDIFATPAA